MNDEIEPTNPEPANDDGPRPGRINPRVMAGVIIGGVVLLAFAIWFFAIREGGDAGRPVPAPRGSFEDQPSEQQLTGVTVTLTPEQAEASGIMLETVGEQLAADSGQAAATGVVEADAYRETPAVSLVSGVVRRVIPELGQNVSRGQTVAVVSSNEFAETQSRYVSLLTERENARRNYERTQRLVTINQPLWSRRRNGMTARPSSCR